jgi:hypothetical protein
MFASSARKGKGSEAAEASARAGPPFHFSSKTRDAASFSAVSPCYLVTMSIPTLHPFP